MKTVAKVSCTNNWSIEWDNKPVLLLVMQKPKMTYGEDGLQRCLYAE